MVFRQKQFTRLLKFIKLYEQNPSENCFILHYLPKLYFGFNCQFINLSIPVNEFLHQYIVRHQYIFWYRISYRHPLWLGSHKPEDLRLGTVCYCPLEKSFQRLPAKQHQMERDAENYVAVVLVYLTWARPLLNQCAYPKDSTSYTISVLHLYLSSPSFFPFFIFVFLYYGVPNVKLIIPNSLSKICCHITKMVLFSFEK